MLRESESIPLPLLVTGVAGVTGLNAFHYFASRFPGKVIGIRAKKTEGLNAAGIVACDAEDAAKVRELFAAYQFRSVLFCGGNCALKACELNPQFAEQTNVHGIATVLPEAQRYGSRLVHVSIDLVFSGQKPGNYTEEETPDPVTVYGKTMVQGEEFVLAAAPEACVLRISLPMGISFNGHAGAIDWIQSRFRNQRPATLYFDEIRTPTYTACLNRLFHRLLASDLAGLFHAGGPRKLSLYQIAQIVNRIGGYDPHCLKGCPRIDAGPMPPRAGNVTLDSSKLIHTLGENPFDPWPLDDDHVPTSPDWHFSRPEAGSPERLARFLYQNSAKLDPIPDFRARR